MLKKTLCFSLLIISIFLFPQSVNASFDEDVTAFKNKYPEIYASIDPALSAKMNIYLQDVVNYVVLHYSSDNDLNTQIKNAVASVLLTGDTYKYDLLPFLLEQSTKREIYQAQLTEMKLIVRKEAVLRLNISMDAILIINKNDSNDIRQYNYIALNKSYASYKGDQISAGLFVDYFNKIKSGGGYRVYALHDDISKLYADIYAANIAYAFIKGKNNEGTDTMKFNLTKYTSKNDPRFPDPVTVFMPSKIIRVVPNTNPSLAPTSEVISTPDI